MTFKEAYQMVDGMFKRDDWQAGGVELAGETDKIWLFKSKTIKSNWRTPIVMVVDRDDGEMHCYSMYDHYESTKARIVDLRQALV